MIKVNLKTMEATREPVPSFLPDSPDLLKSLHWIDPNYGLNDFAWWPTMHIESNYDPAIQRLGQEILTADPELKVVVVSYTIEEIPAEEIAAAKELASQQFQYQCVLRAQQELDNFAKTRNYDGILSACSYATSTIPKFRTEGERAVYLRDLTWDTLYKSAADVNAGTKPMPATYEEIGLPELVWEAPPQEPV